MATAGKPLAFFIASPAKFKYDFSKQQVLQEILEEGEYQWPPAEPLEQEDLEDLSATVLEVAQDVAQRIQERKLSAFSLIWNGDTTLMFDEVITKDAQLPDDVRDMNDEPEADEDE